MRVLLTGGAGYIGSHVALALLEQGHDIVVLDNLVNGNVEAIRRVESITGRSIDFVKCDLASPSDVDKKLDAVQVDAVIHLAGLKSVSESVARPTLYYRVNLASTLTLLEFMRRRGIVRLVFSSSATVYGRPKFDLVTEEHPVGVDVSNPYGWSKAMNEQIIRDVASSWPEFAATSLRYFNPVGAHASGLIGESPIGAPNNLLPYVAQVAVGVRSEVAVFGDNYPTPDGTGVRDYIHVMDLAEGHVAALDKLVPGVAHYNLGTGRGVSVFQAIRQFEQTSGSPIPFRVVGRRPGDLPIVIADPSRALRELRWSARRSFEEACKDAWTWHKANPQGFGTVQ